MKRELIKGQMRELPEPLKAIYLNNLAHELTVTARDSDLWGSSSEANNRGDILSTILEIEHVVTGQVRKFLLKDHERYPDDVLVDIIFDRAETAGIADAVARAFDRASAHM